MNSRTNRERTILQAYVGQQPPSEAVSEAIDTMRLQGLPRGEGAPSALDAAVADALLQGIRASLPQWAAMRGDGRLVLGRLNTRNRRTRFKPALLFTLNWADSAPGYSWPMAYHMTPVHELRRAIVTASADCPDAHGFCDFAIGSFDFDAPFVESVQGLIAADWARQAANGQRRWAYLFDEGLFDAEFADAWADEVWPQPSEDDDE